jgi:subfamily B ATP-binding cassette protein MsbA
MSPKLTLLAIAIIPISGGLIATVGRSLKKSAKKAQEELGQNTSALEEVLTNLPIIKAFVAEEAMSKRYEQSLSAWTRHMVSVFRKRDLSSPIAEVLGVSVLLVVLYLGGNGSHSGAQPYRWRTHRIRGVVLPAHSGI